MKKFFTLIMLTLVAVAAWAKQPIMPFADHSVAAVIEAPMGEGITVIEPQFTNTVAIPLEPGRISCIKEDQCSMCPCCDCVLIREMKEKSLTRIHAPGTNK